jgi:hypothetical protein
MPAGRGVGKHDPCRYMGRIGARCRAQHEIVVPVPPEQPRRPHHRDGRGVDPCRFRVAVARVARTEAVGTEVTLRAAAHGQQGKALVAARDVRPSEGVEQLGAVRPHGRRQVFADVVGEADRFGGAARPVVADVRIGERLTLAAGEHQRRAHEHQPLPSGQGHRCLQRGAVRVSERAEQPTGEPSAEPSRRHGLYMERIARTSLRRAVPAALHSLVPFMRLRGLPP